MTTYIVKLSVATSKSKGVLEVTVPVAPGLTQDQGAREAFLRAIELLPGWARETGNYSFDDVQLAPEAP